MIDAAEGSGDSDARGFVGSSASEVRVAEVQVVNAAACACYNDAIAAMQSSAPLPRSTNSFVMHSAVPTRARRSCESGDFSDACLRDVLLKLACGHGCMP